MCAICGEWDRTHYVYVRLPDVIKQDVGGFDGMLECFRRHPQIFQLGEFFVRRADPSSPNHHREQEPSGPGRTPSGLVEDSPYHKNEAFAQVWHYLTPDDGTPTTLGHLMEVMSPAMKGPAKCHPRMINLVQSFPNLLKWSETAPGQYSIWRTEAQRTTPANIGVHGVSEATATIQAMKQQSVLQGGDGSQVARPPDGQVHNLEVEEVSQQTLSVIQQVQEIIPKRGCHIPFLEQLCSPQIHAQVKHVMGDMGGIRQMIYKYPQYFVIVENRGKATLVFSQSGK